MHNDLHVVEVGFPRGGTSLLYHCLKNTVKGFNFCDHEVRASKMPQTSHPIITKKPADLLRYKKIRKFNGNHKFLLIIRDPRSVLTSIHKSIPDRFKMNADTYWRYKNNRLIQDKPGILKYGNKILELQEKDYACVVYYEDLLKSPDKVQKHIGNFFGFKFKDNFSKSHIYKADSNDDKNMNGNRPLDHNHIVKWKKFPHRLYNQFVNHPELFILLRDLGYEENDDWFTEIKEILDVNSNDSSMAGKFQEKKVFA